LAHDLEHPVSDALGHGEFGDAFQDGGELVATQAGDGVTGAEAAHQASGNLDEHLVASVMAEAVVHGFEPVQVG